MREKKDWNLVELGKVSINDSNKFAQLIVSNYQAKQIHKEIGKSDIKNLQFYNNDTKFDFNYEIGDPFQLYELCGIDDTEIWILRENIQLEVYIECRWFHWAEYFSDYDQYHEIVAKYRRKILDRASLFGCDKVIICPDQGPAQCIYDNVNLSSKDLLLYTNNKEYAKGDKDETECRNTSKHFDMETYMSGKLKIEDYECVQVIFDVPNNRKA